MNARQYWIDRGKDGPRRDGFVCLGLGDQQYLLSDQIGITLENLYCNIDPSESLDNGYLGSEENRFYYLTDNKFDELFPEQDVPNEFFVGPASEVTAAPETYSQISHSQINNILTCLQIGFENTEEVFILNGQRTTRSDRMNAARLEQEMLMLNSCIEQLKEKVWTPF